MAVGKLLSSWHISATVPGVGNCTQPKRAAVALFGTSARESRETPLPTNVQNVSVGALDNLATLAETMKEPAGRLKLFTVTGDSSAGRVTVVV